jgi:hypothetical protein
MVCVQIDPRCEDKMQDPRCEASSSPSLYSLAGEPRLASRLLTVVSPVSGRNEHRAHQQRTATERTCTGPAGREDSASDWAAD